MTRPLTLVCGRLCLILLLAAVAGGCATRQAPPPPKRGVKVILLPQADGSPSAVVVTSNAGVRTLSTPYQAADARVGDKQAPTVTQTNPREVSRQYGTLFAQAPAKPAKYTLYFRSGSAELTAESRVTLFDVMLDAFNRGGAEIQLVGHTDSAGIERLNDRLAERRARTVETMLVERGFTITRIRSAGKGEHDPAVPTRNGVDEPRNRRVEVLVK